MRALVAPVLLAALMTVTLAGCVDTDVAEPAAPDTPTYITVDGREYRLNQWLLDDAGAARNTQAGLGSEPAILVRDNGHIWIGDTVGMYRSTDGGATWVFREPLIGNVAVADGWDLAEDDNGVLYAAGLAEARLAVYRSTTNGDTWDTLTMPPDIFGIIPDRPWIDARGDGQVMLVFNQWPTGRTHCMVSYDGGVTWPDHNPTAGGVIAGNVRFDEAGYAYFADFDGQVFRKNPFKFPTNQGVPDLCRGGDDWRPFPTSTLGANNLLQVAAGDGDTYLAYADSANDIYVVGTPDFGGTSKTLRISDSALKTNTFATIAEEDGRLAIAWYGSETDGNPNTSGFSGAWNVYVAIVDDFWAASPNVSHHRITAAANHVGPICMNGAGCTFDRDLLDYFMIDLDADGDAHIAYAHDGSGSNPDVYYALVAP